MDSQHNQRMPLEQRLVLRWEGHMSWHVLKPETPKRNHRNETTETAETKPPKRPKRPKRP